VSHRAALDEATLIRRYFDRPRTPAGSGVRLGIGDDAAIMRLPPGWDLVAASDMLVEGVHFPRGTPAAALGHRVLAVNLSDLAAMGAEPLWATLQISLPRPRAAWLRDFSRGLRSLASRTDVTLVGGDTVAGPLTLGVTLLGRVRPGRAVRRTGARPGDALFVTGTPGDAVAGRLLARGRTASARRLRQRFLYPEPRLATGRALVGIATAMLDVSDGLHDDVTKLLAASGCGADLEVEQLPLSADLRRHATLRRARQLALTGGDDYELLFTVPAARVSRLGRVARLGGCNLTRLGTVTARRGARWHLDGLPFRFRDTTFRHFG
jgi:thiamine-monophosphate kinase